MGQGWILSDDLNGRGRTILRQKWGGLDVGETQQGKGYIMRGERMKLCTYGSVKGRREPGLCWLLDVYEFGTTTGCVKNLHLYAVRYLLSFLREDLACSLPSRHGFAMLLDHD